MIALEAKMLSGKLEEGRVGPRFKGKLGSPELCVQHGAVGP